MVLWLVLGGLKGFVVGFGGFEGFCGGYEGFSNGFGVIF